MNKEERAAFSTEYWRFLWSAILIALSGCLGNVVDGMIVGHLIGEDGVSAINLSRPVVQLMFTLSLLVETGAGMLVESPWERTTRYVCAISIRSL